jgi:hypothetical protein
MFPVAHFVLVAQLEELIERGKRPFLTVQAAHRQSQDEQSRKVRWTKSKERRTKLLQAAKAAIQCHTASRFLSQSKMKRAK